MTAVVAENDRARWLDAAAWAQLAKNAEAVNRGQTESAPSRTVSAAPRSDSGPASAAGWYADGYDWACIAQAETGSDWTMHGSQYATAFGISTGASEQTPESLAGTASPEAQLGIAIAVERRAGIHAWASNTLTKCGIQ